jgi:arylsulfatase
MSKRFNGIINVDDRDSVPDWEPYLQPVAPEGAPNVLYIVLDDVGFSAMEPWGGLIDTPNINRLAERGLTYTNWHTTALCSPTRSSLLTGRNHTTNGMACIAEATTGFPNSNGHIPFECATIPEVLSERGWNTYMLGKWHLVAADEMNLASTKRNWPIGRGFERYYGFLGGETNQWYPDLVYDNHLVDQPALPEDGYHLSTDLTDKALEFIKDAKVIAPDKPFFMYFCPGATHAPHHAPKEWIEKYKGKFDMGYERYRELVFERQKKLGIMPENAELTPLNPYAEEKSVDGKPWPALDVVRPWDSLSDEEKGLSSAIQTTRSDGSSTSSRRRASWRTRSSCSCPTTARAARAARTGRSTRTSSSTAFPTRWRRTSSTSTSWDRRRPSTTTRSGGPGRSTRLSRCGSATTSRAASPTR